MARKRKQQAAVSNLLAEAAGLPEQKKRKKAEKYNAYKLYRADVQDAGGRDALAKRCAQVKPEELSKLREKAQ